MSGPAGPPGEPVARGPASPAPGSGVRPEAAPESAPVVLQLLGVSKMFGSGERSVRALAEVSLEVRAGSLVLFLGPSGSGKTTLLTVAAGLLEPTGGQVRLFGQDVAAMTPSERQALRALRLGFIFQNFLLIDSLTAEENVALACRFAGLARPQAARSAREALDRVGIGRLARRFPPELSQGEKQRVAVARAMVKGAELILADEPTASLDIGRGLEIIELLHDYARTRRRSVLVASHDPRLVDVADRVLRLDAGRLAEAAR